MTHDVNAHNEQDGERNANMLLSVLLSYAPHGAAQRRINEAYAQHLLDGDSWQDIHKALAGYLLDGLNHGNWLWDLPVRAADIKQEPREKPANPHGARQDRRYLA